MGWSPEVRSQVIRLRQAARRRVRIDTRALAAHRVALGLLLLADLLLRARSLTAFYTDAGVLPRSALLVRDAQLHPSVHVVFGDVWGQALLFCLAGAFALALVMGYQTSLATFGSWVLLVSLHNRMPGVLNGGDVLLRLLLFWALFLPLGARWSVDSRQQGSGVSSVASVASAAVLLQVVLMYLTNGAMKSAGEFWLAGTGIEYAFSLDQFTVLLGDYITAVPAVLHAADYLWLVLVFGSFLLVVFTGRRRTAFVLLLGGMHLGMLLTMRLGLFPLISMAGLLVFLPSTVWDTFEVRAHLTRPVHRLDAWHDALARWLPTVSVRDVPSGLSRWVDRMRTAVPVVFLVLVLLWNVHFLGYTEIAGHDTVPETAEPAIELTRTDQYWSMFAPDPYRTDGWVVAPGVLASGERVDAFHGGAVTFERPRDVSATYPSARWRKYLVGLWKHDTAARERFATFLCTRWNERHETTLQTVTVFFVEEHTRIDGGEEPIERVRLARQRC